MQKLSAAETLQRMTDAEFQEIMSSDVCTAMRLKVNAFEPNTVLAGLYIALVKIAGAVAEGVIIEDDWYNVNTTTDLNIWVDNSDEWDDHDFTPHYGAQLYPVVDGNTVTTKNSLRLL